MPRKDTANLPHSWAVTDWPAEVFPNKAHAAHYLVRSHETALTAEGALVRIGRQRVILGAPFSRWLAKHSRHVAEYQIAPNRDGSGRAA